MSTTRTLRFTADQIGAPHYVVAGSPSAATFGLVGDVCCVNCGARISHVFVTDVGPIGGDCLATITGDASTRAAVRTITRRLAGTPIGDLFSWTIRRNEHGESVLGARWVERDHRGEHRYHCAGVWRVEPALLAAIVREHLTRWADTRGVLARGVEVCP